MKEKETIQLTEDNLKKACEVFDLDYDQLIKGETENPFLSKGEESDELTKARQELLKAQETVEKLEKGENEEVDEGFGVTNPEELMKGLGLDIQGLKLLTAMIPGISDQNELVKGLETKLDALSELPEKLNALQKGLDELVIPEDRSEEIKKALDGITALSDRIEKMEKTPIYNRKSITSNAIEKGFSNQEGVDSNVEGKTVFSISKQRASLSNLLGSKAEEEMHKGVVDGPFQRAALGFDATKQLSKEVIGMLNADNIVVVD